MFLSFIVPAYNVESFIERCVSSICNQNIPKDIYEIIVVNDGSTDNTLSAIKSLISKYAEYNIALIDKPNGGLSSARNAGLAAANGEYIWFVDSDDYIEENCLFDIKQCIEKYNKLDVLLFGTDYVYDDAPSVINLRRLPIEQYIKGSEVFFTDYRYPYSGAPFAIYKKKYLESLNLEFKEGIYYEDVLFTSLLLANEPQCVCLNKAYYHYYMRSNSITHSKSSLKKCFDTLVIADEFYITLNSKKNINNKILYHSILLMLSSVYRQLRGLDYKEKMQIIKAINSRKYWVKAIRISKKYKYIILVVLSFLFK